MTQDKQVERAAEMIWHRFAPPTQIEWQDEHEKAPYFDCARDVLSLAESEMLKAALDATVSLVAALSILRRAHDERKEPRQVVASDKMFLQMLDDYEKSVARARAAIAKAGGAS